MSFIRARHAGFKTNLRQEPKRALLHYLHKINFRKMEKKKHLFYKDADLQASIIRKKEKCSLTL